MIATPADSKVGPRGAAAAGDKRSRAPERRSYPPRARRTLTDGEGRIKQGYCKVAWNISPYRQIPRQLDPGQTRRHRAHECGRARRARVLKNWRASRFNPKCHRQRGGGNRCVYRCGDIVDVAA
jgi:hypothetical protein